MVIPYTTRGNPQWSYWSDSPVYWVVSRSAMRVILVDDGSRDESWSVMHRCRASMRSTSGHSAAHAQLRAAQHPVWLWPRRVISFSPWMTTCRTRRRNYPRCSIRIRESSWILSMAVRTHAIMPHGETSDHASSGSSTELCFAIQLTPRRSRVMRQQLVHSVLRFYDLQLYLPGWVVGLVLIG